MRRSSLRLGETADEITRLATDERHARLAQGATDDDLIELVLPVRALPDDRGLAQELAASAGAPRPMERRPGEQRLVDERLPPGHEHAAELLGRRADRARREPGAAVRAHRRPCERRARHRERHVRRRRLGSPHRDQRVGVHGARIRNGMGHQRHRRRLDRPADVGALRVQPRPRVPARPRVSGVPRGGSVLPLLHGPRAGARMARGRTLGQSRELVHGPGRHPQLGRDGKHGRPRLRRSDPPDLFGGRRAPRRRQRPPKPHPGSPGRPAAVPSRANTVSCRNGCTTSTRPTRLTGTPPTSARCSPSARSGHGRRPNWRVPPRSPWNGGVPRPDGSRPNGWRRTSPSTTQDCSTATEPSST